MQWFVQDSLGFRFALWWEEVSFFSSGGQGCMRWYFCLLKIWFVFVLFIVRVRLPALGAASWLSDARSCIQVEAFVGVLTNKYSLGVGVFW